MARRKRASPIEDLVKIVALLPWWAAVVLGVLAYVILHRMATPIALGTVDPVKMSSMIVRSALIGAASAGQYIVPLLCFAAASLSAVRRRQRQSLVSNVAAAKAPDALDGITWQQFEMLVGEAFRLQGYHVTDTGGAGPDGGVDLVLRKGTEKSFVQCKQWKAFKVSVQVVRELYGVMAAHGAAGGFVVTSGRFTGDAVEFAKGRNVTLVDGPKLFEMIRLAQASLGSTAPPPRTPQPVRPPSVQPANRETARAAVGEPRLASAVRPDRSPACPVCSRQMMTRTAKRGANAGGTFWGCTGYPQCKGTRPA